MRENSMRKLLPKKLVELDLKLDIKRLTAEFEYSKSRSDVFEQAIKSQQIELDGILETSKHTKPNGDFYR